MALTYSLPLFSAVFVLLLGILHAWLLSRESAPRNKARELSEFVSEGLRAFFGRVVSSIIQIVIYLSLVLFVFTVVFDKHFSWIQVLSFFIGGSLMGLSTYVSLVLSPKVVPVAVDQGKGFLSACVSVLFRASATIGFFIVGLMMTGLLFCYVVLGLNSIIGYGLGIICSAFFLRVGGGIYKAATNIGSVLIDRIDAKVPVEDPRSPATVLRVSGEYVSHITGFGSDVIGSFVFAVIACMFFPTVMMTLGYMDATNAMKLFLLPLFVVSVSCLVMWVYFLVGRLRLRTKNLNNLLLEGIYVSMVIVAASTYWFVNMIEVEVDPIPLWGNATQFSPFWPFLIGLVAAVVIGFTSEVLTSSRFKPTRSLLSKVEFGSPILLMSSLSVALKSNVLYLTYLLFILVPSFYFAGFYGVAMAAMGMLSVSGPLIMAKAFSPLADHAKTLAKLTSDNDQVHLNTTKMSRLGYTTFPLGNGLLSGASVVATFGLFFSVVFMASRDIVELFLVDQWLLIGILLGVMIPFIFSGFLLQGLYRTTLLMFEEVSRQFKEIPYLYEDQARPDIIKAVDTIARKAMDALIWPGIIMGLSPIVVGFVFGEKMLLGLLLGVFLCGFSQSFYWANFGDSLQEAKSRMEQGHQGGAQSPTFSSMVIADTVGEAFRQLLSPSMNILLKSVTIIALLVIILL